MNKVKNMICKFLVDVDQRISRLNTNEDQAEDSNNQQFFEEWATLTWNVLCITSRLQASINTNTAVTLVTSAEDKVVLSRLNAALVQLVNRARPIGPSCGVSESDAVYKHFFQLFAQTLHTLHDFYSNLETLKLANNGAQLMDQLQQFHQLQLQPCVDAFKDFCNERSVALWQKVRAAQITRVMDYQPLPDEPITQLVAFYSNMVYTLAILAARLQGFRYEALISKGLFGPEKDPIEPLSECVYSALELLMSDCVLATEPSTNPILVTNNLFPMHCGALARGVVFRDFTIQVVTEDTAEHIMGEMRRQKMVQRPADIGEFQSAALLALKPTSGVKRTNSANANESGGNTGHKKSDVNSKDEVAIYPVFNVKYRFWAATYPHMLCTTRQKSRHSASYQDLSPGHPSLSDALKQQSSVGKRPIFYFHVRATLFSPSGRYSMAHTLSLPFTIATRRNQDCQVQRMMSSYTATCFWLYGTNIQNGLLLCWTDIGMDWNHFKHLYSQYFKVNADVNRVLLDGDFELLQYKLQCNDCINEEDRALIQRQQNGNGNNQQRIRQRFVTFKNVLCPHLRYECNTTNVRFSVWRGMLELVQIFQDNRTNVRQLWENGLLSGFLEFDHVASLLGAHQSTLIMRLSFVTGGSICFTVKSNVHGVGPGSTAPLHLEPLDLKRLQQKSLLEYLRDIAAAEHVKYILNARMELERISDVLAQFSIRTKDDQLASSSRDISSNVTHTGDIDMLQHLRFTAMRIAVVTCKVKSPSSDYNDNIEIDQQQAASSARMPNGLSRSVNDNMSDGFVRELNRVMDKYGKSAQETIEMLQAM